MTEGPKQDPYLYFATMKNQIAKIQRQLAELKGGLEKECQKYICEDSSGEGDER